MATRAFVLKDTTSQESEDEPNRQREFAETHHQTGQKIMKAIPRKPPRDLIRDELLETILSGELKPGQKLNQSDLAADLGVSRTPLREAMIRLEHEGILESDPGRGFTVAPLDARTARELYSAVAELEELVLRKSWNGDTALLEELSAINAARGASLEDKTGLVELDLEWHNVLISGAENSQIKDVIALLRTRQYRYEYHYMKDRAHVMRAIEEHDAIIDALRDDDLDRATSVLSGHWRRGLELALAHFG